MCVRVRVGVCVRVRVRVRGRVRVCVSLVPLSRCFGLWSSIDFRHAKSASLDIAGFEDACRRLADLCRW